MGRMGINTEVPTQWNRWWLGFQKAPRTRRSVSSHGGLQGGREWRLAARTDGRAAVYPNDSLARA